MVNYIGSVTNILDVTVPFEAPDPVNFNVSVSLTEQVNDLGLGQLNAPNAENRELVHDGMDEVMEGAFEESLWVFGKLNLLLIWKRSCSNLFTYHLATFVKHLK